VSAPSINTPIKPGIQFSGKQNKHWSKSSNPQQIIMSNKSSSRSSQSSSHRPKLARASATAPSLATSNASRQDLANLQSTRASTLLTRVASYSNGSDHSHHPHHYNARYSPPGSLCSSPEQHSPTSDVRKQPYGIANYHCKMNLT
jgi:hypothetical protein